MSTSVHQVATSLRTALVEYIEATYHIADPKLLEQRRELLEKIGVIHQAPFLESTPRYESGRRFSEISGLPSAALEVFQALAEASLQFCQKQGGDHFWISPDGNGALYWCTDAAESVVFFGFKLSREDELLWLNVLSRSEQIAPSDFTQEMTKLYRFRTLAARQQLVQAQALTNDQERDAILQRAQVIDQARAHIDLNRGAKVCRYGTMRFGTYTGTFLNQAQYQYHEFEGSVEGRIDDISGDKKSIKVMVTRFVTPEGSAGFAMNTPIQMGSLSIPNTQNTLIWDDADSWGACVGL